MYINSWTPLPYKPVMMLHEVCITSTSCNIISTEKKERKC
jgi:hypothetical protein